VHDETRLLPAPPSPSAGANETTLSSSSATLNQPEPHPGGSRNLTPGTNELAVDNLLGVNWQLARRLFHATPVVP
jgi:hypothetical protein